VSNPSRSRISVVKWEAEGLYIPVACQQCEDAPCKAVCPVKAISRDPDLDYVKVDYGACIGCRLCVAVCPFGVMNFDAVGNKVIKCDLCDGNPTCVRFCDMKAVDYVDTARLSSVKKKEAAQRQHVARKKALSL
jgi:Fe-S-cluster-containing hydrogenase component 2